MSKKKRKNKDMPHMWKDYKIIKSSLLKQQKGLCYYCDKRITTKGSHIDHIKPVCKNGTNEYKNLALACPRCNSHKGSLMLRTFLKKLSVTKDDGTYRYWRKWRGKDRERAVLRASELTNNMLMEKKLRAKEYN